MPAAPFPYRQQLADRAARLVAEVHRTVTSDPRRRAELRRALGRPPERLTAWGAHAVVAPCLPHGADPVTERAFYAVASLIAAQPRPAPDQGSAREEPPRPAESTPTPAGEPGGAAADPAPAAGTAESLGAALGRAVAQGTLPGNVESRLHLLCRQDVDGLHRHLPRLITRLGADRVPVDWVTLLVDLARWGRERDQVVKRWLQDYYRTAAPAPDPGAPTEPTEGEGQ